MVKAGVTGGIGSGKTTVCHIWQQLGAYIVKADDLAKNIMKSDPDLKQAIIDAFGVESYSGDGSLNRSYLAEQAFSRGRVDELNAIVHPYIPGEVERLMEKAEKEGYPAFIYEAALLLQNLRPPHLDYIVLVLADAEKRIRRVQERDKVDRERVTDRMENQQDFEQLIHKADIVIRNNGTLDELKLEAKKVYNRMLSNT